MITKQGKVIKQTSQQHTQRNVTSFYLYRALSSLSVHTFPSPRRRPRQAARCAASSVHKPFLPISVRGYDCN